MKATGIAKVLRTKMNYSITSHEKLERHIKQFIMHNKFNQPMTTLISTIACRTICIEFAHMVQVLSAYMCPYMVIVMGAFFWSDFSLSMLVRIDGEPL